MKNTNLLKSTSLVIIAFAIMGMFFTSANTKESVDNQAVVALSAELAKMKSEVGTLKMEKEVVGFREYTYLGEITMFAGNFAPRDWAFCNGQLLPIDQYSALFSILGTTYGGDGRSTFALPDLRGRTPIHAGDSQGPGLSQIRLGQRGGVESITPSSRS